MELTLRKERITYGVPAGVPRDQGPGGQVEMGEQGEGDEVRLSRGNTGK